MREVIQAFSAVELPFRELGPNVSPEIITALDLELNTFGYRLGDDLRAGLLGLNGSQVTKFIADIRVAMVAIVGADQTSVNRTLFRHFPYSTPATAAYPAQRRAAWLMNELKLLPNDMEHFEYLSCGHFVDTRVFNLADYNGCPICEQLLPELDSKHTPKHQFVNITPFKTLNVLSAGKQISSLVSRMSSLTPDEKTYVVSNLYTIDPKTVDRPASVYRENLPLVAVIFRDDTDYVSSLMKSATDVLRIATFYSNTNGDLSLTENVKFALSTPEKRRLLKWLEARPNLTEDMMRHREKWLRLGEQLAPANPKNRKRFPKAYEAFNKLRSNPDGIATYSRKVDRKVRSKQVDADLLTLLKTRPGEFIRRLDFLLRTPTELPTGETVTLGRKVITSFDSVITALEEVANKAPLRMLLDVYKYLGFRAQASGDARVFIPKGTKTKITVQEDQRAEIPTERLLAAREALSKAIIARFAALATKKGIAKSNKIASPELSKSLLPFNARGASSTNIPVNKGSRYPLNKSMAFVRLFLHWKSGNDIDLSAIGYDWGLNQVTQLSFTALADHGAIHSGDVRSAYNGGSEFIDIDLAKFRTRGIRYVMMSVIVYSGTSFADIPECFAGYMERDGLRSGQNYEPQSVALKFDLNGATRSHVPLILDLEEMEMIYADMSTGGGSFGAVANHGDKYKAITKAMLSLPNRKVTVSDVLDFFYEATRDESLPLTEVGPNDISLADVMALLEE